jgi:pimeloyl-ACP methyl ester carboxylesterase
VTRDLFVEEAGDGSALLAVHGLGGGAWFFTPLIDRLREECRVLALDLPGTGRSRARTDFTLDGWVTDLGALVRARGAAPVVLLGHSMGTIVALRAWRAWPDMIRGLVPVGGLPRARPAIRERLSDRLAALESESSLAGWGRQVSPGVFSPAVFRDRPEIVSGFETAFESQDLDSYRRSIRILLDADAAGIAATVTVPTLIISGTDDQYAPPASIQEFAREFPSPPRVEILEETGHLPFLERPDAFAAAVSLFLRRL